jgi:mono/diheme cytochrome c family protein
MRGVAVIVKRQQKLAGTAMHRSLLLFCAAAFLAAVPLAIAQPAKPALYTADQATAGAAVYAQNCAACHGTQMEGVSAPALKGAALGDMAAAQGLTAQSLLDVVVNTMPQSDPGSLKPEEYAAVTAYILQQNGYPAGSTALVSGAAGLKDAKITP